MSGIAPVDLTSPGPVPADDVGRALTHVSPDSDDSLLHLGVVGDTYTILVSGADTAGRYTLIDMHVPPGGGPPPHRQHRRDGRRNGQRAGQRTTRFQERFRAACAATVSLFARRPRGVLQGGRRAGGASNAGSTGTRRCRHCSVHCEGRCARPEVPDRTADRGAQALARATGASASRRLPSRSCSKLANSRLFCIPTCRMSKAAGNGRLRM